METLSLFEFRPLDETAIRELPFFPGKLCDSLKGKEMPFSARKLPSLATLSAEIKERGWFVKTPSRKGPKVEVGILDKGGLFRNFWNK